MDYYNLALLASATTEAGAVTGAKEYTIIGILLAGITAIWFSWRRDHERYLKANENAAKALSDALKLIKNQPKVNEEVRKTSEKTLESISSMSDKTTEAIHIMAHSVAEESAKTREEVRVVKEKCESALSELLSYIRDKK